MVSSSKEMTDQITQILDDSVIKILVLTKIDDTVNKISDIVSLK